MMMMMIIRMDWLFWRVSMRWHSVICLMTQLQYTYSRIHSAKPLFTKRSVPFVDTWTARLASAYLNRQIGNLCRAS